MIYSVVDDRGGVAYQEYHCVRGEDVEAGLRFLFNVMAPKPEEDGSSFQGIPAAIWSTSRLIIKSSVFNRVMEHLGAPRSPRRCSHARSTTSTASPNGYDARSIAEEFHVKPADVRLFLQGQLDPARTRESQRANACRRSATMNGWKPSLPAHPSRRSHG
jgi:hypothetical protein